MSTVHEVAKKPNEQIEMVRLGRIHAAEHNRSKLGDLTDLIASVREKGVIVPLLVRPTTKYGKDHVEIVYGERRSAAGTEAGLTELPCIVREMDDDTAYDLRLIENLHREALDILDETDALRRLFEDRQTAVREISARIGKTEAYIYARLKLCALVPEGKKALQSGKISASTALRVARINPKLQAQAVEDLTRGGDIVSDRMASDILGKYQLRLTEAPFDRGDATLVPEAGNCKVCPKRSGNQADLFADVKNKDTCMDPLCFEQKKEAHWKRVQKEAEAAGRKVLAEKDAKRVLNHGDAHPSSGYVDLGAKCETDKDGRTYGDILKRHGDKLPVVVARDASGKVHELVEADAAKAFLPKKAQEAVAEANGAANGAGAKSDEDAALEKMKKAAYKAAAHEALALVAGKAEDRELDRGAWLALVTREFEMNLSDAKEICAQRNVEDVAALQKKFERMTAAQLRGIYMQITFDGDVPAFASSGPKGKLHIEHFCEAMRVDLKGLASDHLKRLKDEAKAKEAKAAKAAAKKGEAAAAAAEE